MGRTNLKTTGHEENQTVISSYLYVLFYISPKSYKIAIKMNMVGVVTFLLAVTAVAFADEHCQGFIVNNHCYFTIIGNFNLEVARQQCDSAQAQLAVIKTEQVFEATKAYVGANYDHSTKYNVFWVDQ